MMPEFEINFFHFSFRHMDFVPKLERMVLPYIDLTYCVEGEMQYIYEGEELTLRSGDAILFPKGSVRIRKQIDKPALYASFNVGYSGEFDPLVKGVIRKSLRSDTVSVLESVRKSHDSLAEHRRQRCGALFLYLYYQLIDTVIDNENPHIKHVKKYIAEHLTEKITLSDIAEAVHLVPNYCCSLFSKYEGMGIFDFINAQRVQLAKNLIASNTLSLSEVAERSGFLDYNYFARVFREVEGCSPGRYRKETLGIR
jgi:AraC-like DNA-binding protein